MRHGAMRSIAGLACLLVLAMWTPIAFGQEEDADAAVPSALTARAPTEDMLAAGDPARGRVVFGPCRTCHYPDLGAGHQNGPSLWAIFGRKAGTQEGFAYYSEALRNSGIVWTPAYLDAWLADPPGFIPGNGMMSLGVPDAQARADLIAYLGTFRDEVSSPKITD